MKPKGTKWCNITDNTIRFKGEQLWQIEYWNGALGGFVGEDVSLPDSFCAISENSKILKGSTISGEVSIDNTIVLNNTTIKSDTLNVIKIFNSTIGGYLSLAGGVIESSKLLGRFTSLAFFFYIKDSFFSENSNVSLDEKVSSVCFKNVILADNASITMADLSNDKITLEMSDSCLSDKSTVFVGANMSILNTEISGSAQILSASLYDCAVTKNAKIAYVILEKCAINCNIGYSESGEPVVGAQSVSLSDVSTFNNKENSIPVFINTYNDNCCLTYYPQNGKKVFFHCKNGEKYRYNGKISIIIMIKKHIFFMSKKEKENIVFRDFDYFTNFIKAIKDVFRDVEEKPSLDVVACAFSYSYYVMLRNYYLEKFDDLIGGKIYDEYFIESREHAFDYLKKISSFTFVDIQNKKIKIDMNRYIITDVVLDTFKNKKQAKSLLEKDKRFVFL